jgi:diadenosine tetraphosphate (Ap4A) HIT family hydrolase
MRNLSERPFYGLIKEYDHWVVLFRDNQVTPGSLIIMDKTVAARSLGDVSGEAWAEFGKVCKDVEEWVVKAFNATKFNYVALMMKDPEVHFHVIPRYDRAVEIDGQKFTDQDWPLKTELKETEMNDKTKELIKQEILRQMR